MLDSSTNWHPIDTLTREKQQMMTISNLLYLQKAWFSVFFVLLSFQISAFPLPWPMRSLSSICECNLRYLQKSPGAWMSSFEKMIIIVWMLELIQQSPEVWFIQLYIRTTKPLDYQQEARSSDFLTLITRDSPQKDGEVNQYYGLTNWTTIAPPVSV